jgi:hypothetical protein
MAVTIKDISQGQLLLLMKFSGWWSKFSRQCQKRSFGYIHSKELWTGGTTVFVHTGANVFKKTFPSLPCCIMIKLLVCPICTIYKVFSGSFVFKNVLQIILYIRWQNWGIWTDTNPGHDVVMQTVHKMHQLHS